MDILLTGMGILLVLTIATIPVFYLYEKGKKDQHLAIAAVALVIAELSCFTGLFDKYLDGWLNIIKFVAIAFGVSLIGIFIIFIAVNSILEAGRKEFYKDKEQYKELLNKNENELTEMQVKRLAYLEKNKEELLREFSPKLFIKN